MNEIKKKIIEKEEEIQYTVEFDGQVFETYDCEDLAKKRLKELKKEKKEI